MTKAESLKDKFPEIARAEQERRRPGRPQAIHQALISLLRAPTSQLPTEIKGAKAITDLPVDDRRVAKGISMAALVSTVLWTVIVGSIWLLHRQLGWL